MAQLGNGIEHVERNSALPWCSCAPHILVYPPFIHTKQPVSIHVPSCSFRGGSSSTCISYKLYYSLTLFCSSAPNVILFPAPLCCGGPLSTISQTLYPKQERCFSGGRPPLVADRILHCCFVEVGRQRRERECEREIKQRYQPHTESCGVLVPTSVVGVPKCCSGGTTFIQSKSWASTRRGCCSHLPWDGTCVSCFLSHSLPWWEFLSR